MPRSTRPPAARPPSSGSSASAARRSASTTRSPRRRPTTPTSAWACASWSTARWGSPPRSTSGPRRRPTWCAGPGRWPGSRAGPAAGASSWRPSRRTATSPGRAPSTVDPSTVPLADKVGAAGRVELGGSGTHPACLAHVGLAARRVGADLPGRPQRDAGHPAPGAPAGTARGAGALGRRLRDDAHAGAAGRARLGVPGRSGVGDGGWDWDAELAELPELLAEKLGAPSVEAGTYDLVVDPSNLWLDDPRVDRARHRARPGRRLRGGLRRDLLRHLRPARLARLRLPRHARHR